MEKSRDFEEFFESLNRNEVRYLVVGGYAFAVYAEPRYTKDVDIFFDRKRSNAGKLICAIRDFGFESLELTSDDFTRPGQVIQIGHPPLRIDLINEVDGVEFKQCWRNKIRTTYGDQNIYIIGKNDLIKNKKATGREQDLLDAGILERTK